MVPSLKGELISGAGGEFAVLPSLLHHGVNDAKESRMGLRWRAGRVGAVKIVGLVHWTWCATSGPRIASVDMITAGHDGIW